MLYVDGCQNVHGCQSDRHHSRSGKYHLKCVMLAACSEWRRSVSNWNCNSTYRIRSTRDRPEYVDASTTRWEQRGYVTFPHWLGTMARFWLLILV